MQKPDDKTENIAMLLIHSMQVESWADMIKVNNPAYKQEFKMRTEALLNHSRLFNKYMTQYVNDELFELSAVISDSLMKLFRLPPDKVDELTEIMNQFIEKHESGRSSEEIK